MRKLSGFAALLLLPALAGAQPSIELSVLGRHSTGLFDAGAAEIPTFDPQTQRAFVVNVADHAIDVLDLSDPGQPLKIAAIDVSPFGAAANSVAVSQGLLAAAIEAEVRTDPGVVAFFDTATLALKGTFDVGALPDMVTFSPDGRYAVVANEGEPSADYSIDPEGSVSIIDIKRRRMRARQVRFDNIDRGQRRQVLEASGVRIFGPGASVAQDLEPEYIAISPDSRYAYVTLQENNAIAVIDLRRGNVQAIHALGRKDHRLPGNGLDASDKDDAINIASWPVQGMYMPDSIAMYVVGSERYLVTANEGDAREYGDYVEEARIKDLLLDPTAFPDAEALQQNDAIGRLTVSTASGDIDGDGDFDRLDVFGARSFSIWTESGDLVYDSGDAFEQITAEVLTEHFNANNDGNKADNRSDNKGPEPEGVALGRIDGRDYAFIGLERVGGIMVYDISNPIAPEFVQYINPRDFDVDPEENLAQAGDLGPEGLHFINAEDSPNGQPLLIVGNEISGTTTVYQINIGGIDL
ncbi:alkaline phosphatase [Sinimarinibacterium sp. CAU 1509]|uniref:choice-of-anchor I family protein n=1 Tax=Sinimarinibacterium sp. CAU 1509 TaxID=2562283 RepID=UPI0010AC9520|nr:choice-of-anchor I family protein [Sinimarinibacterium sp. CAU 1509]TJY63053.1 alkaline phosphatase [Sinimarinibacterium sp. CAU 1509]